MPDLELLTGRFNLIASIVLMMIGFYALIGKTNLVKKLIGMNIFQWAIILFVVSMAAKRDATIPIVRDSDAAGQAAAEVVLRAADYDNPLPHVLMLTAIVVGVATTGVALALLLRIHRRYGTLDDEELRERMRSSG
ncbi:MAG: cation:proton antiporter subunit C [Acidobacteria bacterium]|nr:cation:proton antiporter subunit C [Acidobacteriota bacterium]